MMGPGLGLSMTQQAAPSGGDGGSGGGVFNPEAGLTVGSTLAPGALINMSLVDDANPIVLAADFTGLDGEGVPGLIAEMGAAGGGTICGFAPDGTFQIHAGIGDYTSPAAAYSSLPAGVVAGDGTLVAEFDTSTGFVRVRVWWNGAQLIDVTSASARGRWSGTNNGRYLGKKESSVAVTLAVTSQAVGYSAASDLRVYPGQLVAV